MPPALEITPLSTAEEFLGAILPLGGRPSFSRTQEWIFRGEACEDYKLLPTSLRSRSEAFLLRALSSSTPKVTSEIEQVMAEFEVAVRFAEMIDTMGLEIPEDSQRWRQELTVNRQIFEAQLQKKNKNTIREWPILSMVSLLALGQHNGLPTRLLDWSYSPEVAAYFAASGCKGGKFVVWAFKASEFERANETLAKESAPDILRHKLPGEPPIRIAMASAPRVGNRNLHAQSGLFTMWTMDWLWPHGAVSREPLDALLDQMQTRIPLTEPLLLKFTCPHAAASDLLELLDKKGISAATLFPDASADYKEAAQQVLKEWA